MQINDYDLYMKFQRQPRVLGTQCYYAPSNKLLIPNGIKKGEHVFICAYTQSDDDVYVTVCDIKYWANHVFGLGTGKIQCSDTLFLMYIKDNVPAEQRIMVVWKDLAQ